MEPRRSNNSRALARGTPEASDVVHDEIRQLASEAKRAIQTKLSRHGTNAAQVLAGIEQFGPSGQSKTMLRREAAAATSAMETGVYVVWRNESSRTHSDFCCRVGPSHKCLCSHNLEAHGAPRKNKQGFLEPSACGACACRSFAYVPNEPEEVGDHWVSRRPNFVPGAWAPSCACSHSATDHDGATRKCKRCSSCFHFQGKYGCVVCDGKAEDHVTVFETMQERMQAGRPTNEAFFPLADLPASLRERVLGRQAIASLPMQPPTVPSLPQDGKPVGIHCRCGAPFRSQASKFCSKCGAPRSSMTGL